MSELKEIYPRDVYESGRTLLSQIGSFWEDVFTDSDKLVTLFQGSLIEAANTYRRFLEYMATASRADCPVFARDNWYYLTIKESNVEKKLTRYGDDEVEYGTDRYYGVKVAADSFTVPIPANLKNVEFIFDKIIEPEVSWTAGADFTIASGNLTLSSNPFDIDTTPKKNIIGSDGQVQDRETGVWLYNAEFDMQYVWQHYGYALGVFMQSSTYYKDFINAIGDAYLTGPSLKSIQGLLQAMVGVPLVRGKKEVVEDILTSEAKTVVITDLNTYTYKPTANVIVSKGDTVYAGDSLTDSLQIFELYDTAPTFEEIPAFVFGKDFCIGSYEDEIVFENKETDLVYEGLDEDNKARVSFKISGRQNDIQKFWEDLHTAGKDSGKVLAEYLDTRTSPITPTTSRYLPSKINPLKFVFENLMSNNLFIIRMRTEDFVPDAPGVGWFKSLRRILTPHTTYIVYIEFSPEDEYINLSENEETINLFDAGEVTDSMELGFISESILLREVTNC